MKALYLGLRLLRPTDRAGLARVVMTGLSAAIGTAVILGLLSVPSVVDAQSERLGRQVPVRVESENYLGPEPELLAARRNELIGNRDLYTLVVADLGSAPLPAWLDAYPAQGEIVVSPSLRSLIRDNDYGLATRFWQRIIQVVGEDGLIAPNQLFAIVGVDENTLSERQQNLSAATGIGVSRAIHQGPDRRVVRRLAALAAIFVVVPTLILVATSARLSARTRQRRLAALRLIGLSGSRTSFVNGVETVVITAIGSVAGVGLWRLLTPLSQDIGLGPLRWFAADVEVAPATLVVVVVGLVVVSLIIVVAGSASSIAEPLRERRSAPSQAPRGYRPAVLAAGISALVVTAVWSSQSDTWLAVFALGNILTIIGLCLALPTLSRIAGALLIRSPRASFTVAGRRLIHQPSALARVASGLLVVVFVAGFAQTLLIVLDWGANKNTPVLGSDEPRIVNLRYAPMTEQMIDAPTIRTALPVVELPTRQGGTASAVVATCSDLEAIAFEFGPQCDDTTVQALYKTSTRLVGTTLGPPLDFSYRSQYGGTDAGATFRVPPRLLTAATDPPTPPTEWTIVLAHDATNTDLANTVLSVLPAADITSSPTPDRGRLVSTYRALVNLAMGTAIILSLTSTIAALVDRTLENRRTANQMLSLGVAPRSLRTTEVAWLTAPTLLGLTIALAGSGLAAIGVLRVGTENIPLSFPWTELIIVCIIGAISFLAATASVALATPTKLTGRIESDA